MTLILTSPNFKNMESIPSRYTCDGENISPALHWEGIPKGTKTFVLILDDPEIPAGIKTFKGELISVWDHWVIFNIPSSTTGFPENVQDFPAGTRFGIGSHGKENYHGPCPPDRRHNYFFKLYALDCSVSLKVGVTKREVEESMKNHIIEEVQLIGNYDRLRK